MPKRFNSRKKTQKTQKLSAFRVGYFLLRWIFFVFFAFFCGHKFFPARGLPCGAFLPPNNSQLTTPNSQPSTLNP